MSSKDKKPKFVLDKVGVLGFKEKTITTEK